MEIFVWIMFILLPMMGLRAETNITEDVIRITQRMDDADLTILSLQAEVTSLKTTLDLLVSDSETGVPISVTAIKEDVLTAVSTLVQPQLLALDNKMCALENKMAGQLEVLVETNAKVDANKEIQGYFHNELREIRDTMVDVKIQQANLTTTLDTHLSNYLQQIQDAVDGRERCQTGNILMYGNPELPIYSTKTVEFDEPFRDTPSMAFGVTHLDVNHNFNLRLNLYLGQITQSGFTFHANPWQRHVYGLAISWMACPN